MYALGRNLVKQGARRCSSTAAVAANRSSSERQKIPLAVTATVAAILIAATPISSTACMDSSVGGISMEKLTFEWVSTLNCQE